MLNGGRLVVLASGTPSVARMGDAVRRHGVTTLWLTAALFNVVVEQDADTLGLSRMCSQVARH